MRNGAMGDWLERLGSSAATPGGGAAAALVAASAAALVEMVVNLTIGKTSYLEHEAHVRPIGERARALRTRARALMSADEAAFQAVLAAYRRPKETGAETAARAAAIEAASAEAARPPLHVAEVAAAVIELAAALPGRSNATVLSDVGVAASLAVAALESAAINVEVNLVALTDDATRDRLRNELDASLAAAELGRRTVTAVRDTVRAG